MTGSPAARPRDAADRRFELIALALFTLCVAVVSALHEPWNDETQTWRMAIDSDGLAALVRNARYEGHPVLFHLLLQALSLLSRSWWAAVVLHVVIACAAAWVVLRYAPFTRLEKALVVSGYYPAYEYAVIVRPYGLTLLLAFGACAAWTGARRRPWLALVLLVLLANTTALGAAVALAAGAALVVELLWRDDAPMRITGGQLAIAVVSLLTLATAAIVVAIQVIPPADAAYRGEGVLAGGGVSAWNIAWALTTPLRAMAPLSPLDAGSVHWNHWLFRPEGRAGLGVMALAATVVVAAGGLISMRRRTALLFFLVGTGGLIAFFAFFFSGNARHHGHLVIVWIMAAWLARSGSPTAWPPAMRPLTERARRWAPRLFVVSLVPMALAAAQYLVSDALRPFSGAKATAEFLRDRSLDTLPILAVSRSDAQAVSALLDRPVVNALDGRFGTFTVWGTVQGSPTVGQVSAVGDSLLALHCEIVLISTRDADVPPPLVPTLRMIYETPVQPMSVDRYRVWIRSAAPSPRCPAGR